MKIKGKKYYKILCRFKKSLPSFGQTQACAMVYSLVQEQWLGWGGPLCTTRPEYTLDPEGVHSAKELLLLLLFLLLLLLFFFFFSGTLHHGLSPLSCFYLLPLRFENIRKKLGYMFRRKWVQCGESKHKEAEESMGLAYRDFWQSTGERPGRTFPGLHGWKAAHLDSTLGPTEQSNFSCLWVTSQSVNIR